MRNRVAKPYALLAGIALMAGVHATAIAEEFSLAVVEKAAPESLSEAIRGELQGRAIQLLKDGEPVYEYWLRKEIPLTDEPASEEDALAAIAEITLLGAVKAYTDMTDYRGDELYENVFTMRLALQPEDGDHLDTAEYPYFALLIPASMDQTLEGYPSHKHLSKASSRDTATDHPVLVSLRPASEEAGDEPKIVEPASEHKSILLTIPAKAPGAEESSAISFEIVFEGEGVI